MWESLRLVDTSFEKLNKSNKVVQKVSDLLVTAAILGFICWVSYELRELRLVLYQIVKQVALLKTDMSSLEWGWRNFV